MSLRTLTEELTFTPLHGLDREGQIKILSIRNQDIVRDNMYTKHIIQEDEHFKWVESLKKNGRTHFYAVHYNKNIIGGISLNNISTENKRADWAFYLDTTLKGKGLGAALEFKFLNYVFEETEIEKLNCEVLDFNSTVVSLHKKFGFIEEGIRRDHIQRDGKKLNAVLLGIKKTEWIKKRKELEAKLFRAA